MKTFNEIEREAFINGNVLLADLAFQSGLFSDAQENCSFDLDETIDEQIDAKIEKHVADNYPDYELYKSFFESCFERLNAHYPCPSITSDYDQSVIFDAISKGDTE